MHAETQTAAGGATCPRCTTPFTPARTNQRYCSTRCQKAATRNHARGSRSIHASPEVARQMLDRFDRLQDLNATFYATRPDLRLPLLKGWLDAARAGDRRLAEVLTCPRFYRRDQPRADKAAVCHHRSLGYPPVPCLADWLAQRLLGCRVWEWVNGSAKEPETGELPGLPPIRSTLLTCPEEPPLVRVKLDTRAFMNGLREMRAGVLAAVPVPTNLPGIVRARYMAQEVHRPRTWRLAG